MAWTAEQLADACGGTLHGPNTVTAKEVITDTRRLTSTSQALFVGLRGPTFDGDDFATGALRTGASGVLVHQGRVPELQDGQFAIEVEDTLYALGELARVHLENLDLTVIAITGSNGKTTTKEMTAAALEPYGVVLKNPGNHNNRIGLPLTVLGATAQVDYLVLELGMNEFGEISRLTEICKPDVGVVVSIGAAHLEGVGSIAGVIKAKGELYQGLSASAIAVVPSDDANVVRAAEGTPAQVIDVGANANTVKVGPIRRRGTAGLSSQLTISGQVYELELRTLARHDVQNGAIVTGILHGLGLELLPGTRALERHTGVDGRVDWIVSQGLNIIDDTYNANPSSVAAALRTLGEVSGQSRSIAVLGDMLELGDESASLHYDMGVLAADVGVDVLYAVGNYNKDLASGFYGDTVVCATDAAEITHQVAATAQPGDWILIKGSRGMKMERVVHALTVEREVAQ
jgi:UDP-N-acetylmuramoyl-tripeptide--D-alanyl-D-alanine ligase